MTEIESLADVPRLKRDVGLAPYTTWNVGGNAEYFWKASEELLPDVIQYCRKQQIPIHFIGRGSNVLVDSSGLDGLTICTNGMLDNIRYEDEIIEAQAGVPMPVLSRFAMELGWTGYEFFIGIPGTIGGGIVMNAGLASDGRREIKDVLVDVNLIDFNGNIVTKTADELKLGFRESNILDHNLFVLSARFEDLEVERSSEMYKQAESILSERKNKQPLSAQTAGSTFKNPVNSKRSAGWYIDEAGLKGKQIGGAKVSETHANWIENVQSADSDDILSLIEHIQKVVKKEFGIDLETEIEYITNK